MINIPSLRYETRYGLPPADQYLFNREYIVGYSYLFRQPRWTLETIKPSNIANEIDGRLDNFRADLRVPKQFRAGLEDYRGSGFDRGHLVPSADRRADEILNSETFLLTNMSPQHPDFNQKKWRHLEEHVRNLLGKKNIAEVYVVTGPIFEINKPIKIIGDDESHPRDVVVPIPHSFFKSVLAETVTGKFKLWSFIMPNEQCPEPLSKYLVRTDDLESKSGLPLWDRISGADITSKKKKTPKVWFSE